MFEWERTRKKQPETAGRLRSKGIGVSQSNLFEVKTLTSDWSNIARANWAHQFTPI